MTDKEADAERVKQLYGTEPRKLGSRFVVGVKREAAALGEKPEQYFARLKSKIRNSTLSEPLRGEVLSNMDYNDYYGLGLIMITIPTQRQLSYVDEDVYWRDGDETVKAVGAARIANLALRFAD